MPLTYELESSYPLEMKLAENALERIEEQLGICLPASEKAGIAPEYHQFRTDGQSVQHAEGRRINRRLYADYRSTSASDDPSEFVQLRPVRDAHAVSASADQ